MKTVLLLALVIGIYLFLAFSLIMSDPPIWPDEPIYGDIAKNILLENRAGTSLFEGTIPGAKDHAFWIPPFFVYSLAAWFKITGFSILNQRIFSTLFSAVAILLLYLICKRLAGLKHHTFFFGLIIFLLLGADNIFLKSSRIGRPETLALFLGSGGILCYLESLKQKNPGKWLFMSGVSLGLSLITHMLAFFFTLALTLIIVISLFGKWVKLKEYFPYMIGIFIPILIWALSIYPEYNLFIDQLKLIADSRNYTLPLYQYVLSLPLTVKAPFLIYIGITLIFIALTISNRQKNFISVTIFLILSWIFAFWGGIQWYLVYPVVFSYLALFILAAQAFITEKKSYPPLLKVFIMVIIFSLIYFNLRIYTNFYDLYSGEDHYKLFSQEVKNIIPSGKTVFLSSIPDAYYPLEGRNKLYSFPPVKVSIEDYRKVLDNTDYLVFNNFYSPPNINQFTQKYLDQNVESFVKVNSSYQVLILKLKEKDARVRVN